MFKIFCNRRNHQARTIDQLHGEVNRLAQRNEELSAQIVRATDAKIDIEAELSISEKMAEQRMETITAMREFEEEIKTRLDELETENHKLRDGAGHALHALAAVQDVASAFVKRLDMLPPMCGLPQDLVNDVFADFDTDLQARQEMARGIVKQSVTIERNASDEGYLIVDTNGMAQPMTVQEVKDVFFKLNGFIPKDHWEIKFEDDKITGIKELGLFTIKIDFGKQVTAEGKLWIVPTTKGLE